MYTRVKEKGTWRIQLETNNFTIKITTADDGKQSLRSDQQKHKYLAEVSKVQNATDLADAMVKAQYIVEAMATCMGDGFWRRLHREKLCRCGVSMNGVFGDSHEVKSDATLILLHLKLQL